MKEKENNRPSWREAFRLNGRAFCMIYKKYPKMIISRFACIVWDALTPYISIYLSARIIGELAGARDVARLRELVLVTLGAEAFLALGKAMLTKWKNYANAGYYFKMEKFFEEKLLDMDFIDIDDSRTHDLYYKIHQFRSGGGWGLMRVLQIFEALLSALFTILGGIVLTVSLFTSKVPGDSGAYMLLNHPLFLLAVVAVMFAVVYLAPALATKADRFWAENSDARQAGNRMFCFKLNFIGYKGDLAADVRIYHQDLFMGKYDGDKSGTFDSKGLFAKYTAGTGGFYYAASTAVSVAFTGVVYAFVCLKAWAGAFAVGEVTQYIASITKVSGGVSSIVGAVGDIRNNAPFLKENFRFLDIPNTMYQGSLTVEKRKDLDYEVEFKNVSFCYPGSDAWALKNINMKFRIGQRLAVVGQNGSGKTTFIKLLCRLYDPTEGEILLNGINIQKYNYLDYMSIFSVVFQDFKLFAFPLGQNVAAGVEYDPGRAGDCLVKAGFGGKLQTMPEGLETYLYKDFSEHGVDISGGEAQKIAIARALYKSAPFIVLDEPTAALDPIAEAEIYGKFNEIVKDKTAIYISHRLSSCRFCDDIAVFDKGRIVQQGSHESLAADAGGKYYELWNAQAQYYT